MSSDAQNMKTGPDAIYTAENESGRTKHEIGPNNLRTAKNVSESAKHENGTRRPCDRRKYVRERKTLKRDWTPSVPLKMSPGAQNMKSRHDALCSAENVLGSAKYENGT
jgi:hypothetical protein